MSNAPSAALRPYLCRHVKPLQRNAYVRFYAAVSQSGIHNDNDTNDSLWSSLTYKRRLRDLKALRPVNEDASAFPSVLYPRPPSRRQRYPVVPIAQFRNKWNRLEKGKSAEGEPRFILEGKVKSIRAHGKLVFLDLVEADQRVQIMCNIGLLVKKGLYTNGELDRFRKSVQQGDHYSFAGYPVKTTAGELTLHVDELPQLLSPSLHTVPSEVTDEGTIARFPQLGLAIHRRRRDLLRLRHVVEDVISQYLNRQRFIKVNTPILAADTGGAVAKPFETSSKEVGDTPLRLRIAQELALKKLVAADLGAVYEIGPVFRNEGLDATHNPEFTTCEFYLPYAGLDQLISMTEDLLRSLQTACDAAISNHFTSLQSSQPKSAFGSTKFHQLPFLQSLMEQILPLAPGFRFPSSFTEESAKDIAPLFSQLKIELPASHTTARLLDALASHLLEPLCKEPTFITHHPSIMSPLAKSFLDPETGHLVSARAELFVNGTELLNMYEEENDPFQQARKFLQQSHGEAALKDEFGQPLDAEVVKERLTPGQRYFVRVLEMGLPPTSGWGAGIERLVMHFGGAKKIGDVLPFGNLRNVVAMGTSIRPGASVEKGVPPSEV